MTGELRSERRQAWKRNDTAYQRVSMEEGVSVRISQSQLIEVGHV